MSQVLHGDCLDMLQKYVPESTVNLIVTSPPYGNQRKHSYGGIEPGKYVSWFVKRANEFRRVLTPDGSMILNICPHVEKGVVVGYVNDLIAALTEEWYHKATYYWRKTTTYPIGMKHSPRLKNAVEPCHQFALRQKPAFYPEQVRKPAATASMKRAMALSERDFHRHEAASGSGFRVNLSQTYRRLRNNDTQSGTDGANGDVDGLVYPDNVIECSPETRNLHKLYGDPKDEGRASAPFSEKLPAFFIALFTKAGDIVLDPFAGSGTTAKVAQDLGRRFIAIEKEPANIRLIINRLLDCRNSAKFKFRSFPHSSQVSGHEDSRPLCVVEVS